MKKIPLDNSQISQFQKCQMSYYLQYIEGLKIQDGGVFNAKINFGSAFHKVLENYYGGHTDPIGDVLKTYLSPEGMPEYSREALEFIFTKYQEKYTQIDNDWEIIELEKNYKFNDLPFTVKRDGVIKWNGSIYSLEHKTTGSISQHYFDKYYLNAQITAQVASTIEQYGECSGVLLNVCEIKCLKRKPSKNYFGVMQVGDKYICCDFDRDYINRTDREIDDWKQNTKTWIDKINVCKVLGAWGKATSSMGGATCNGCEYRQLCKESTGLSIDKNTVSFMYERVDPYEYLKENVC